MTRPRPRPRQRQFGVTLVELMVALAVGVILVGAVIAVYIAQSQTYKTSNTQAAVQNAENALGALVTPVVRAAGFGGCATLAGATSTLAAGLPPPLGTIATVGTALIGYDAADTGGDGTTLALPGTAAANNAVPVPWTPALDGSLAGQVAAGSDVLVVLGAVPGTLPVAATAPVDGSSDRLTMASVSGFAGGPVVALSDCAKTSVFAVSSVSGQQLVHAVGGGTTIPNAVATLGVDYAPGAQAVPLQQTAFFVAPPDPTGRSALVRATYGTTGWIVQSLVPGIATMQVLYGIGSSGTVAQYVPAGAVTDWGSVYSVRMGFLIEGDVGSAGPGNPTSFDVLGTTVTVPADTRQRRSLEMTVGLRNAAP